MSAADHFMLCPESPSYVAWARDYQGGKAGDHVTTKAGPGYWGTCAGSKAYTMHRVVYELAFGECPEQVDHKDGDTLNNAPTNLRAATNTSNSWNKGAYSNSKSGVKGLVWDATKQRWRGHVFANGKTHGKSGKDRAVIEAWLVAKRVELHGEFAKH